ncbi:MAG: DUF192 domain-containing protein [Candidatus Woesebacteria bacterium]|nr:DUF192 domain-containing protein [Candidatus Woesebacteria bacterium]
MAVLIINKKQVNVELCDTFLKKFKGLMFSLKPKKLLFILNKESKLNSSIHMMFVFFPIDIFWLDKEMKVIDFKLNVKPFTFGHSPKAVAKYILETPVGELKELKINEKLILRN